MKMWRLIFALSFVLPSRGAQPKEGDVIRVQDRDVYVHHPNYDETRVPSYRLEDPLTFLNGRKVTKENWQDRRLEILGVFAREMYGEEPPPPEAVTTELIDEKVGALAGFAIRRQYRMWFKPDRSGPCMTWIVWLPRFAKKAVPVISFLNSRGNQELSLEDDILMPVDAWMRYGKEFVDNETHHVTDVSRGHMQDPNQRMFCPLGMIIARGYALMSACYAEVSPDPDSRAPDADRFPQGTFAYTRVFDLWGTRDPHRDDNITALGAWSWALSRGLDLAERLPELDAKKSVVTGCSRLGKAALLAAARDERFAVCVPNQAGGGGVTLAKRDFGENVSTENIRFTHWYCRAYAKYAKEPWTTLSFDQHLLVACIAPRALLVEGFDKPWFDTKGEFLSLKAASPVWEMLCGAGLPNVGFPNVYDTSAVGKLLGYVRRTEQHGLSPYDWNWLLNFADNVFSEEGK